MSDNENAKYQELREDIVKLDVRLGMVEEDIKEIKTSVNTILKEISNIKSEVSGLNAAQYYTGKIINSIERNTNINEEPAFEKFKLFALDVIKMLIVVLLAISGSQYVF